MPKSEQILEKLIEAETQIADTSETLEDLEEKREKLADKFEAAIDLENQTAEIVEQINDVNELVEKPSIESDPTWQEKMQTQLDLMQTTLMDSLAPIANSLSSIAEKLAMSEPNPNPNPEAEPEAQSTPLVSQEQEPMMDTQETIAEPSLEMPMEVPEKSAEENPVAELAENLLPARSRTIRKI